MATKRKAKRGYTPRTRAQIKAEFLVEWERARLLFPFMSMFPVIDDFDPTNGADGHFDPTPDGPHFQFALAYAPPLGISWSHRYLHEIGHYVDYMLRNFGMTKAYIRQRHFAWRFRGNIAAPDSWVAQQLNADRLTGQDNWSNLPVEMWAESFVVAVMGYVEQERTVNWGIPFPTDSRAFFVGMMREVAPVVYPQIPGMARIAKSDDDTLLMYLRSVDNKVLAFSGEFRLLGSVTRWW